MSRGFPLKDPSSCLSLEGFFDKLPNEKEEGGGENVTLRERKRGSEREKSANDAEKPEFVKCPEKKLRA